MDFISHSPSKDVTGFKKHFRLSINYFGTLFHFYFFRLQWLLRGFETNRTFNSHLAELITARLIGN